MLGAIVPAVVPTVMSNNLFNGWERVRRVNFKSNWQNWPDMKWVGPEYWANPLQDWVLKNGKVMCKVSQPNRNLHLLTFQKPMGLEVLETSVTITPSVRNINIMGYVGIRLGVKGPFEDYRSAAVFGKGLNIGITNNNSLKIDDEIIPTTLEETPFGIKLSVKAIPKNKAYSIKVRLIDPKTKKELFSYSSKTIQPKVLEGGLALFADFEKNNNSGKSVTFEDWEVFGDQLFQNTGQLYGPICFAQYTLHNKRLKLTAQFTPIEEIKNHEVRLEFRKNGAWKTEKIDKVTHLGRALNFSIDNWEGNQDTLYRVVVDIPLKDKTHRYYYEGTIAREPLDKNEIKAAVFSCNFHYGFPDNDVVKNMEILNPDLVLFLGDQFYEASGGFGAVYSGSIEETSLDYLRKWLMFGWSYREIFRHKPCAIIPDDHDVYHGNVWGEGGERADTSDGFGASAQDSGGYKMSPEWINMMQFTQTSHLPDPYDPTPVKQGIGVYYTSWNYAGVSFAILEDRKFKSAPKHVLPKEADVWNGFIRNPDFDIKDYKNLDAELLGDRQIQFLDGWTQDWNNGIEMKVVLSQTNLATVATLPKDALTDEVVPSLYIPKKGEYIEGDKMTVDMDSNGWPSNKRDQAIETIRKCFAFHIAGDQHMASFVQYGVEAHGDSGYAFAGPALNNIWPRRFWPPIDDVSKHTYENPAYVGNHIDGFGNKMTVLAASNPQQSDLEPKIITQRATGFGLVTFNKKERTIKTECWPRFLTPTLSNQFPGWPIIIDQEDNYGRKAKAWLPQINVITDSKPIIYIWNEDEKLVYSIRLKSNSFKPKVFKDGKYKIEIFDPEKNVRKLFRNIIAKTENEDIISVSLVE